MGRSAAVESITGAEYSVGWPLMSEFAPARLRGRLMGVTILACAEIAMLSAGLRRRNAQLRSRFLRCARRDPRLRSENSISP
jgi:hypothetical protein